MKRLVFAFSLLLVALVTSAQVRSVAMYSAYNLASACSTFVYTDGGGTGAEDGWVTVTNEPNRSIQVDINTLNGTNVQFIIEGRLSGTSEAARIWPSATGTRTETAAGSFIVPVPDPVNQVRLGMCITGDSGTQDIDVTLNTFAPDKR
jgi:hypothetical protein